MQSPTADCDVNAKQAGEAGNTVDISTTVEIRKVSLEDRKVLGDTAGPGSKTNCIQAETLNSECQKFQSCENISLLDALVKGDISAVRILSERLLEFAKSGDLEGVKSLIGSDVLSGDMRQELLASPDQSYYSSADTPAACARCGNDATVSDKTVSLSTRISVVRDGADGLFSEICASTPANEVVEAAPSFKSAKRLITLLEPMMRSAGKGPAAADSVLLRRCLDMSTFLRDLLEVVRGAERILTDEHRLLELKSPCYVLGDIHGNLPDLDFFRRILWPAGLDACPADLLFLGDFVDRGPDSLAVVAYVMALKVVEPQRVWAIRGNHETRQVNGDEATYGASCLRAQCRAAFGAGDGARAWEALNGLFDVLPLAAVLDSSVFCVHGGLPADLCRPGASLDLIRQLPCPLVGPEARSMAFDMLWSDPAPPLQALDEGGFCESARGCRCFGSGALDAFLRQHALLHVLRGHEPKSEGVATGGEGRLTTVFSTSRDHFVPGVPTTCGCVLVGPAGVHGMVGKLREGQVRGGIIYPIVRRVDPAATTAPFSPPSPSTPLPLPVNFNQHPQAVPAGMWTLGAVPQMPFLTYTPPMALWPPPPGQPW